MADGIVAVTGATGELGGRVTRGLAERGVRQRLVVRDAARAPEIEGAEVAQVSGYAAGDEMRRAFEGARTVFLVSAAEAHDRLAQHFSAVDAAAAAGVERIVYTSFIHAAPDSTFTLGRHHFHTEERIRASGAGFTFLRNSLYLDFMPFFAGEEGVIRGPAGEGHLAPVARDDIADVAVEVLAGEGSHGGRTYDLTGSERMSMRDVADKLSRLTGKRVEYVNETIDEAFASRSSYGAPDYEVEGWVTSYLAIAKGELDLVTDTVERLAGHEPLTLADYMAVHAGG
jgi:uncharacterized protein YbjT (DUF2867 family)